MKKRNYVTSACRKLMAALVSGGIGGGRCAEGLVHVPSLLRRPMRFPHPYLHSPPIKLSNGGPCRAENICLVLSLRSRSLHTRLRLLLRLVVVVVGLIVGRDFLLRAPVGIHGILGGLIGTDQAVGG